MSLPVLSGRLLATSRAVDCSNAEHSDGDTAEYGQFQTLLQSEQSSFGQALCLLLPGHFIMSGWSRDMVTSKIQDHVAVHGGAFVLSPDMINIAQVCTNSPSNASFRLDGVEAHVHACLGS